MWDTIILPFRFIEAEGGDLAIQERGIIENLRYILALPRAVMTLPTECVDVAEDKAVDCGYVWCGLREVYAFTRKPVRRLEMASGV